MDTFLQLPNNGSASALCQQFPQQRRRAINGRRLLLQSKPSKPSKPNSGCSGQRGISPRLRAPTQCAQPSPGRNGTAHQPSFPHLSNKALPVCQARLGCAAPQSASPVASCVEGLMRHQTAGWLVQNSLASPKHGSCFWIGSAAINSSRVSGAHHASCRCPTATADGNRLSLLCTQFFAWRAHRVASQFAVRTARWAQAAISQPAHVKDVSCSAATQRRLPAHLPNLTPGKLALSRSLWQFQTMPNAPRARQSAAR